MHEQPAEEEEVEDSLLVSVRQRGKRDRSSEIDSALGMSSLDIPEKSVAQATKLPTDASVASGSTASAPPNSPWPKIIGRPLTCPPAPGR